MTGSILLLFSAILICSSSAQIAGLVPLKPEWSEPDLFEFLEVQDEFLIMFDDNDLAVIDMNKGKKLKLPKRAPTDGGLMINHGKAWGWDVEEWFYCDLITGKLIPHKFPVVNHNCYITLSTKDSLVHSLPEDPVSNKVWESHLIDGRLKWRANLPGELIGIMHKFGDVVAFDCETVAIIFDCDTGKTVASLPHPADRMMTRVQLLPDIAVMMFLPKKRSTYSSFAEGEGPAATVVVLDLKSGKPRWSKTISWPAEWAGKREPLFMDEHRLFCLRGRIYIECGASEKGVQLITMPLGGGSPDHRLVTVPGLKMGALVGAGNALCGIGKYPEVDETRDRYAAVGFDHETMTPVWITEPLAGEDHSQKEIWSPREGIIVTGMIAVSSIKPVGDRMVNCGVSAFKIPAEQKRAVAPAKNR